MPAGLPGSTLAQNQANPSAGQAVLFSSFSGPKGSPFDAKKAAYYDNLPGGTAWSAPVEDPGNISTGGLSTGIGFGLATKVPGIKPVSPDFNDDYTPGVTSPSGIAATASVLVAIGGGKCAASDTTYDGIATPVPYTAGFGLLGAGNGGSRDAGAGPAYTGFEMKTVTATTDVANGAVIETGYVNRQGVTLKTGDSQFGSATAASAAPA